MIAAAATFHVQNVTFGEKESYATLESIGVMAEAWQESGGGGGSLPLYRVSCSHYNNYWECRNTPQSHWTCSTWSSCR